jgi:DNA repair photolyase
MPIIYEPKGKAREYSPLAANIYKGCSHRCEYCYVPGIPPFKFAKNPREAFFSSSAPRPNVLAELAKDAKRFAGDKRLVLMSFTSDPYQPAEREHGVIREAIKVMAAHRLRPQILTKGGAWAIQRDADVLRDANGIWAATLTTDNPAESLKWEPGAALPTDRIEALRIAKAAGLETWVSLEPVIDPDAAVRLIDQTHQFVDLFKVGKLNYHPLADKIDWADFLERVEVKLDEHGAKRYIKIDLEAFRKAA